MNRDNLYYKTVDLLLDAYNNGSLKHGNCQACAVGNICNNNSLWSLRFYTENGIDQKINNSNNLQGRIIAFFNDVNMVINENVDGYYMVINKGLFLSKHTDELLLAADKLIESTGYTQTELARIEFAFENSIELPGKINKYRKDSMFRGEAQFIGLTAVLDVLSNIHEVGQESKEVSQTRLETIYNKCQEA